MDLWQNILLTSPSLPLYTTTWPCLPSLQVLARLHCQTFIPRLGPHTPSPDLWFRGVRRGQAPKGPGTKLCVVYTEYLTTQQMVFEIYDCSREGFNRSRKSRLDGIDPYKTELVDNRIKEKKRRGLWLGLRIDVLTRRFKRTLVSFVNRKTRGHVEWFTRGNVIGSNRSVFGVHHSAYL